MPSIGNLSPRSASTRSSPNPSPGTIPQVLKSTNSHASRYMNGQQSAVLRLRVRSATILRSFTSIPSNKMDPYVELFVGGRLFGRTPHCRGGNMTPIWEHSFDPQGCEVDDYCTARVFDKNSWPRKDVFIGEGQFLITSELLKKREVEEIGIRLYKEKSTEKEHTGTLYVGLNFIGPGQYGEGTSQAPSLSSEHSGASAAGGIPGLAELRMPPVGTSSPGLGNGLSSPVASYRTDSTAATSQVPGSGVFDRGQDQVRMSNVQGLIVYHYWKWPRVDRRRDAAFCTAGVRRLFCDCTRRLLCCRCCCCCSCCCGGQEHAAMRSGQQASRSSDQRRSQGKPQIDSV